MRPVGFESSKRTFLSYLQLVLSLAVADPSVALRCMDQFPAPTPRLRARTSSPRGEDAFPSRFIAHRFWTWLFDQAGILGAWWEIEMWCGLQTTSGWVGVGMTSVNLSLIVRPHINCQTVYSGLGIVRLLYQMYYVSRTRGILNFPWQS